MTDKYKQLPTDGRVKRFEFLMLDKHSAYTDDYGPEDVPTHAVPLQTVNTLLENVPSKSGLGVILAQGESQVILQNTDRGPYLTARWVEYGHDYAEVTTPLSGETYSVEHLRKSLEEANTTPEDMPGAILETGDLLLGGSVFVVGGHLDSYLGDLLENVKASELMYELEDVVQGHVDYLLGDEPRSPIFQIRAHAKLMGRDKGTAYEFLKALESIAKREYEGEYEGG